jgi:hypothetical protein
MRSPVQSVTVSDTASISEGDLVANDQVALMRSRVTVSDTASTSEGDLVANDQVALMRSRVQRMIISDMASISEDREIANDGAAQRGAGLRMVEVEAMGDLSVSGVKASVDESDGALHVEFQHGGREYAYKLNPQSVYTEDAKVYVE